MIITGTSKPFVGAHGNGRLGNFPYGQTFWIERYIIGAHVDCIPNGAELLPVSQVAFEAHLVFELFILRRNLQVIGRNGSQETIVVRHRSRPVWLRVDGACDRVLQFSRGIDACAHESHRSYDVPTARAIAYHRSGGGKGWKSYTELYLYYHTRNRLRVFRKESRTYRAYVAGFTIANAAAKAAVIARNCVSDPAKMLRQWKALWRGLTDGLIGGGE